MWKAKWISLFSVCLLLCLFLAGSVNAVTQATLKTWGGESMTKLATDFKLTSGLYAESLTNRSPAFVWGQGVMLDAIVQAAKVNPTTYKAQAETLANLIQTNYWRTCNNKSGYNASAGNCGDRYTDDNAWIALALLELYEVTGNTTYRTRAANAVAFCMSCENASGGIRWHETDTCGAAVCSTAPTCLANLILYQKTGTASYLTNGLRLYNWLITSGVQASSGNYNQGIRCDGTVNGGLRGYQTAVPLQAAVRLFQITGTTAYRDEAQRLAAAMECQFVNITTHALGEVGYWGGHDMTNAYVELSAADGYVHWRDIAGGYLQFLHDYCKFSGRYPDSWNNTSGTTSGLLLAQASVARAYWKLASTAGGTAPIFYHIKNRATGKCLRTLDGSKETNAHVTLYDDVSLQAENWTLIPMSGSSRVKLFHRLSGKALYLLNGATANNTCTVIYPSNGSANALQWTLVNLGNGYYTITNYAANKSLRPLNDGSANNTDVVIYTTDTASYYQQWQLVAQ